MPQNMTRDAISLRLHFIEESQRQITKRIIEMSSCRIIVESP